MAGTVLTPVTEWRTAALRLVVMAPDAFRKDRQRRVCAGARTLPPARIPPGSAVHSILSVSCKAYYRKSMRQKKILAWREIFARFCGQTDANTS